MSGHAQELPPRSALPDAICPGIEALVHRRAGELVRERPRRRRVAALSSVGGVAVAAVCAVLVLVVGAPSGSGPLSARQAVAAVATSLDGNGILHWVREQALGGAAGPERTVTDERIDLANGDSHTTTRTFRPGADSPDVAVGWISSGVEWSRVAPRPDAPLTIYRKPRPEGTVELSAVGEIRETLARADRGEAEIAAAGEYASHPLVVVTERGERTVRRVWITREDQPRVVRTESTVSSPNHPQPVVATSTTTTWQVLPRTPESLADVEIPTDAKRVQ